MNFQELLNTKPSEIKLDQIQNQIKILIFQRQDIALNVALVIVSVLFSLFFVDAQGKEKAKLITEISALDKKIAAIENYTIAAKTLNQFEENLQNGLSGEKLITTLSDYAAKRNIQILSISPASEEKRDLYNLVKTRLSVQCKNYKDIILFVSDIETAPYTLRIESISGSANEQSTRRTGSSESRVEVDYNFELIVGSINFIYEKTT
jgi:hypothetical protein